jgi:mutator protein MutT
LSAEDPGPVIHVVAGAVTDGAGRVLIAQRPKGTHLAGGWEFPGGKLEPGEDRRAGLARELREELGITIGNPRPLIRLRHSYPEREVLLDMWVVRHFSGEPQGLDGQSLRWCTQDELETVQLLPADGPIVRALRLPERLVALSTEFYVVHESLHGAFARDGRLQGVLCASAFQAADAVDLGADFIVLSIAPAQRDLVLLCQSIPLPLYARGTSVADAWESGATGISVATSH